MGTLIDLMQIIESKHKKILITSAQRSGTTIAATMIAEDSNLHLVKEETIKIDDLNLFFAFHRNLNDYVLQAPGLSFICHRLPVDLVVFMRRNVGDIYASEQRVNWNNEWNGYEAVKYFEPPTSPARLIKYRVWDDYQKPFMEKNNKMFFDLDYESLKSHPLWVDKSERINFHARQTK